tara:strand:+ start:894 stop:1193 length:300 start_codon:yes stop_codon:yes gene_type:complete
MSAELEDRIGNLVEEVPAGSGLQLSIPSLFETFDVVGWDTVDNSVSIHVPAKHLIEFFRGLPLHGLMCESAIVASHTSAEYDEGVWTVHLFLNDMTHAG